MIRKLILPACLVALFATACTSESRLPDPSGKGSVRAINAIPGSPRINFRIEERSLGEIPYKASTTPTQYDDFDYVFNFDIDVPGQSEPQRVGSLPFKVEADRDHVFVVTGDIANPTITPWTIDEREWQDSDTVFETYFAHLSVSMGEVDVFLDDPANPPVAGLQAATLSYGEILKIADFPEGSYQITVTTAGDVGSVLYQSDALSFAARNSHLLSILDGNENDTSPYVVSSMTASGQAANIFDPSFPPTVNFVHAARTLQAVDIYEDELLTNLLASNVSVGESSGDLDTSPGTQTFYLTPTGSVATTLFSPEVLSVPPGVRWNVYVVGDTDVWQVFRLQQDRAPWSNAAKVSLFNGSFNHQVLDLYILDRGVALDDDSLARAIIIGGGFASNVATLAAGSYDIYVTTSGTRDVRDGPVEIDVALGDVLLLLAIDEVDPDVVRVVDPFAS